MAGRTCFRKLLAELAYHHAEVYKESKEACNPTDEEKAPEALELKLVRSKLRVV